MDSQEPNSHEPLPQEQLVLRPFVKYLAIGLGVASLLGIEYATYRFGVERGYAEGVSSGEVPAALNARAVANLRHFMQMPSADDATLINMVQQHQQALSWIKDPLLLHEARWALVQALITRGLAAEADALMREQLADTTISRDLWTRRALVMARALSDAQQFAMSSFYYDYADAHLTEKSEDSQRLQLLSEQLAHLPAAANSPEQLQKSLSSYAERSMAMGDSGKELSAGIFAWKGKLYREQGTAEALQKANLCFEKALKEYDPSQLPELAGPSICVGSMLLERGEIERAEEMIRNGLERLDDSASSASYLLLALRDMARIEQQKGNLDAALALLYRAEGIAMTHEPEDSSFRTCFYDQRGWLNWQRENIGTALQDFEKSLQYSADKRAYRAQPLEGAARCCLSLGDQDKAETYLTACLQIRRELTPTEHASIARICVLLAEIADTRGDTKAAATYYGDAVSHYTEIGNMRDPELISAMFSRAYALTQLHQWSEAAVVWDALLPLVDDPRTRRDVINVQLDFCRKNGAVLPDDTVDEEDETESH